MRANEERFNAHSTTSEKRKHLYRLRLDDYSAASFTSFSKDYFGTLEDISAFIDSFRSDEDFSETFADLVANFDRYMGGEKNITHIVAYQEKPFLVRAKRLGTATSYLENYKWEHINTWGWPYNMKCKEAESAHVWLSCSGVYSRCVRTVFTDLKYENTICKYVSPGAIWGFPHQIETRDNITCNRLFVVEKIFKNKAEALLDMQKFEIDPDPNFTEVLNDVFGDG